MGIRNRMQEGSDPFKIKGDGLEALNERTSRADRLVEKWAKMPEVGSGLRAMSETKSRNLAIMLEKQARLMGKLTEAQYSSAFAATPKL